MIVTLDTLELSQAAVIAARRQHDATRLGMSHTKNLNNSLESTWGWHVVGALGEIAAAKALGVYAGGESGTIKGADLWLNGAPVQVRASTKIRGLRIRPNDNDEHIYVALVLESPWIVWEILGWMYGAEAKSPQWHHPANAVGGESWLVPAECLTPIQELERAS